MNSAAAAASPAVAVKNPSSEEKPDTATLAANPNPNPTARLSRWSDAPPSNDGNSASEPPQKKVKNDVSSFPIAGEGVTGANEAPPGLTSTQTASATIAPPSYGVSSDQASTGYSALQQNTSYPNYGSQYQTPPPVHGSFAPGSAKGTGALFYKTKLCTKFKIGACTFNERCHFAHGVEDLRKPPPLWETMTATGSATPGALGGSFTRPKTRPCRYFAEGNCPYNERCNFLHGNEDPQRMLGPSAPYTASIPYTAAAMQQPVATPAQPQVYGGVSTYPNGGSVSSSLQYPNPNQGYAAPTPYANPSTVPPSLPAPYGTQTDYSPAGSLVQNMTPYGSTPATTNAINPYPSSQAYPSSQEGTNGASANYNSWNGPGVPSNATPAYMQTNQHVTNQGYQTASWMPNSAAGAYPNVDSSTATPQYSQEQAQQSQVVSSTPYVQGISQQSGASMHADGSNYQGTYNGAGYPNQQADYTTRYNMAEAWGGQTQ